MTTALLRQRLGLLVSMLMMRAWASGLRNTRPCSIPEAGLGAELRPPRDLVDAVGPDGPRTDDFVGLLLKNHVKPRSSTTWGLAAMRPFHPTALTFAKYEAEPGGF